MTALTAKAQGETKGTYDPIVGNGKIYYSFSGGKVTDKSGFKAQLSYSYEVEAGATLKFSCYRIYDGKYYGGRIIIWDDNGKKIKEIHGGKGSSTSSTYQVPKGLDVFHVVLDLYDGYTTYPTEVSISCIVKKPSELSSYKGTMDFLGTEMEYAVTNCIVTQKEVDPRPSYDMVLRIEGQTMAGKTVSASFKKLAECLNSNKEVNVKIQAETTDGKTIYLQDKSGKESATASAEVPKNAKTISIIMSYSWGYWSVNCFVKWDVVKKVTAAKDKYFKWQNFSNDNYCEHCGNQYSYYRISKVTDDAERIIDEGDVHIYCSSEPKKSRRKARPALGVIYYKDYIVTGSYTTAVLDKCDKKGVITIMENSSVLLNKRLSNGKDHWKIEKGRVVGKNLQGAECEFEMSACTAKPTGTTYILEDDGKTSRIYLLQGSMEVTSKKGSKKSTLKPGQAATVGTQGQISVNTFDVGAMARKYNISGFATSTTHDKSDRYSVKCAIVKYKYTKGKVNGEHDRVFDNYGKLERRSFKTATTETVTYFRDNKVYTLDLKKKTIKEEPDNQLKFGNPDDPAIKKKLQNGSSTILGKKCAIYRSGNADYYVWEGIVLKKVDHLKDGTTAITEATSLTLPDSLDPTIFVVPKGYKTKK